MKLEGSLDAFSLPDIFQLLSFTKKTGGLHLAAEGSDGVVFFGAGQVSGASADGSRQPLARRLVGAGAVDDAALEAAVAVAASGGGTGVVRALLDGGAVDSDLLREAATEQAVDAVFDLLRWTEGDFAFVMDEPNPDDVGLLLATEQVLADAEARKAAWTSVSRVIPSTDTVLAMPVVLREDPTITREEWALLSLVDGQRPVSELVDLTGSGQFAVVTTLAALVERGLLRVRTDQDEAEDHVAVVMRRQQLLSPLEVFTPASTAPPSTPPAAPAGTAPSRGNVNGGQGVGVPAPARPAAASPTVADPALVTASAAPAQPMLGGAHVPGDVVPPRPEPFLPRRQADFDDHGAPGVPATSIQGSPAAPMGEVVGATVTAPDPDSSSVIERDPSVNRSLMLRLIAGVRGL